METLRRAPAGSVVHAFDLSPVLIEFARRGMNAFVHILTGARLGS